LNKKKFIANIKSKRAKIGVIGLGYVGLPLIIRFSEEGYKTVGFDVDEQKVKDLNSGKSYIKHISAEKISNIIDVGFLATSNFANITDVDAILICVPTPLGEHNEPDLSFIKSTLNSIKPYLRQNHLLVLESTTYPGTTEEEIVPVIEENNFEIGKNFFVGYSPEREDPGNTEFTTKTIPKVVSGYTKNCLEITQALYNSIVDTTVPVTSTRVAEMTKILENIHRVVNIGLVNELKMVADKMDIDIFEVINVAATKPFGYTSYYPGPGLGGHCIPIDPFYLTWKAKEVGMNTRFIELAGEVNAGMPDYVIQKIGDTLNSVEKSIKNSKIFILGLSYKKNVDDLRESPSLVILEKLLNLGAIIQYSDPYFDSIPSTRKYNFKFSSQIIDKNSLNNADLVLLATDHDDFDYNFIEKEAKLIVDTRGRFKTSKNIIKA